MIFGNYSVSQIVAIAIALVVGITFHEFSHAFVADQLGDHRPRAMGRVSLNPVDHIDPTGALVFLVAGFGWGKPVMVNSYALRPGRIGMSMVAAAGPLANLVVAILFAIAVRAVDLAGVTGLVPDTLVWIVFFNLLLGIFNLLPIPPLDGYNLALGVLPPRQSFALQRYAQYGFAILLALILLSYVAPGGGPLRWLGDVAGWLTGVLVS